MEAVAAAAEVTSLPIGTGVLPYNRRSLDLLIDDMRELEHSNGSLLDGHRLGRWTGRGTGYDARCRRTTTR